jgi:hypothetical protein
LAIPVQAKIAVLAAFRIGNSPSDDAVESLKISAIKT